MLGADPDSRAASRLPGPGVARRGEKEFRRWEAQKDLQNSGSFASVDDLDRHLARLVRHGYVRPYAPKRTGERGRKPLDAYEINPTWDRRENRENREN